MRSPLPRCWPTGCGPTPAFDPATGPVLRLNGYTEITGVQSFGRDGVDERQFRFGLRLGF